MERLDESFDRLLAVVAHPDDLEYGASAAIARWSAAGKQVRYGIDLRTSIAREIRRFRPDALLTAGHPRRGFRAAAPPQHLKATPTR